MGRPCNVNEVRLHATRLHEWSEPVFRAFCDEVAKIRAPEDKPMRTQKPIQIRGELLTALLLAAACSTEKQPPPSKDHQAEFTLG
jgi:hypothetical protein